MGIPICPQLKLEIVSACQSLYTRAVGKTGSPKLATECWTRHSDTCSPIPLKQNRHRSTVFTGVKAAVPHKPHSPI